MGKKTEIEWTDSTWNPIRGCSRVSEGCRNCYAEQIAARFSGPGRPFEGLAIFKDGDARWTGKVALVREHLQDPLAWRAPKKIFVNSMSDLFHEQVPDEWIWKIFGVMALAQRHTFQILTKRPMRMHEMLHGTKADFAHLCISELFEDVGASPTCDMAHVWPLPNVWLGVSVEDQETADKRIPLLSLTPAAVRWVSYEPALGPVNFRMIESQYDYLKEWRTPRGATIPRGLDWIVMGGESGKDARPMNPRWARSVRDACLMTKVPFFFKQWGEWSPAHFHYKKEAIEVDGFILSKVGKQLAGALLDGKEYRQFPVRP